MKTGSTKLQIYLNYRLWKHFTNIYVYSTILTRIQTEATDFSQPIVYLRYLYLHITTMTATLSICHYSTSHFKLNSNLKHWKWNKNVRVPVHVSECGRPACFQRTKRPNYFALVKFKKGVACEQKQRNHR